MQALSRVDEENLLQAVSDVAELVDQGAHPTDAVVKAAEERQLPPGQVRLLACAYNTGRHAQQREAGKTASERAAEFPLADAAAALEQLYPAEIKSAAAIQAESVISADYASSPQRIAGELSRLQRLSHTSLLEKAAEARPTTPWAPEVLIDRERAAKQAADAQLQAARGAMHAAQEQTRTAWFALYDYLKQADARPPFADCLREIACTHGPVARLVLQRAGEIIPALEKEAETSRCYFGPQPFAQLVENVLERVAAAETATVEYAKAAAAHPDGQRKPPPKPPPSNSLFSEEPAAEVGGAAGSPLSLFGRPLEKTALGPLEAVLVGNELRDMAHGVATKIAPPDTDLNAKTLNQLTDPLHEANLRNVRTQAMLQDMMANDEHIAGHDPNDVLTAFNEVNQAAPRAADQPLLMRSLIRQRLAQGAFDPFQLDQLLSLENKLKERDMPEVARARTS